MSRRGKHLGEKSCKGGLGPWLGRLEGTQDDHVRRRFVGAGWLLLLGLSGGCSGGVSSSTTVDSLLPESPTSTPSDDSDIGSTVGTTNGTGSNSTGSNQSGDAPAATSDDASDDSGVEGAKGSSDVPTSTADAGPSTGVSVVDGHLPELSPRDDGSTCGIPVSEGPPLCDPVAQCGCGENQACAFTPDRIRMFSCVLPGEVEEGQPCVHDDACKKGSVCANGLCAATCRFDTDCGEDKCVTVSVNGETVENLRVCVAECNPLDAGACGTGATCANAPGTATFTCVRQGNLGAVDDACSATSDCAPGLGCALDGVCRAWCSLDVGGVVDGVLDVLEGEPPTDLAGGCSDHRECLAFNVKGGLGLCGASCPVPDVEGSECSLIPSTCGCNVDGETCQVDVSGKTQCVVPGNHTAMQWCTKNANCGPGLSCVGSLCRPVCDAELLPCADGSSCIKASSAEHSPSTCLGHCDPVRPQLDDDEFTPCGDGAYCSPGYVADAQLGESFCTRQSDTPSNEGAACGADHHCRNGFGCDSTSGTCVAWCRESSDCATGKTCDLGCSATRLGAASDPVGFCR